MVGVWKTHPLVVVRCLPTYFYLHIQTLSEMVGRKHLEKLSQQRLQERSKFNSFTKMELKAWVHNPTFKLRNGVFMNNLCAPTTVIKVLKNFL